MKPQEANEGRNWSWLIPDPSERAAFLESLIHLATHERIRLTLSRLIVGDRIHPIMSDRQLAWLVGGCREHVNKTLNGWRRKGYLSFEPIGKTRSLAEGRRIRIMRPITLWR